MTEYHTITLEGMTEAQAEIVNAVINEGRLRMKEEILAKIERKITENYQDKEMVKFLEELIRELELDM
jgi:hypothetical protein